VIRGYAGENIEKPRDLSEDPQYLLEIEPTVKHFDILFIE